MIRAVRLSATTIAALLLLGACSATYDEEVDPTDPASVAAAIIGYTAHEQFEEACQHSSSEQCDRHLREAHERWASDEGDPSLLEQAKEVSPGDFNEHPSRNILSWSTGPHFADGDTWTVEFSEHEDGRYVVATHALQDGY